MASSADEDEEESQNKKIYTYATSGDEFDDDPGEQRVEDVTIQFFYQPRTLTMLAGLILAMIYFAFHRDAEVNQHDNFMHGSLGVFVCFMVIALLICPNGPFIRPHPAVWRLVLGISIVYTLALIFILFQSYKDILTILQYLDPKLVNATQDSMEDYAEDCSLAEFYSRIDIFVIAHFLGWTMKALILRHAVLLWLISIMWEVTEIAFSHLLNNFKECWWDQIILDILICNGLGIHFGLFICRLLEVRSYHWESIKDIQGTSKKFKRAMLQFTPVSWTNIRWFDPKCVKMRFIGLFGLVIIWQLSELNSFFLKHIFMIPTGNWLNIGRIIFIGATALPSLKQFYLFITDTRCKRVGTQCWIFICITFLEFILSVRHARELFSHTEFLHIAAWLVFVLVVCFALILSMVLWAGRSKHDQQPVHVSTRVSYSELRVEKEYEGDSEDFTKFTEMPRKRKGLWRATKNS